MVSKKIFEFLPLAVTRKEKKKKNLDLLGQECLSPCLEYIWALFRESCCLQPLGCTCDPLRWQNGHWPLGVFQIFHSTTEPLHLLPLLPGELFPWYSQGSSVTLFRPLLQCHLLREALL